jgi:hypothetical protein
MYVRVFFVSLSLSLSLSTHTLTHIQHAARGSCGQNAAKNSEKSLYIVSLYSKYSRAMTIENFCFCVVSIPDSSGMVSSREIVVSVLAPFLGAYI